MHCSRRIGLLAAEQIDSLLDLFQSFAVAFPLRALEQELPVSNLLVEPLHAQAHQADAQRLASLPGIQLRSRGRAPGEQVARQIGARRVE